MWYVGMMRMGRDILTKLKHVVEMVERVYDKSHEELSE